MKPFAVRFIWVVVILFADLGLSELGLGMNGQVSGINLKPVHVKIEGTELDCKMLCRN